MVDSFPKNIFCTAFHQNQTGNLGRISFCIRHMTILLSEYCYQIIHCIFRKDRPLNNSKYNQITHILFFPSHCELQHSYLLPPFCNMPYLVYSEQILRLVLFGSDPSPLHKRKRTYKLYRISGFLFCKCVSGYIILYLGFNFHAKYSNTYLRL